MSSAYGKKWWQRLLALTIIITLPATLIYIDYSTDSVRQYQDTFYSYDVTLNSTINRVIVKLPTDIPQYSSVHVFLNFTKSQSTNPVVVTVLERSQYKGFLVDAYPETELNQVAIPDSNFTGWVNKTTAETGPVYVAFTCKDLVVPLKIDTSINFITEPYVSRKAPSILIFLGFYVIVTFGIIPYMISRYRIDKMKRRKEQERIQEEEEFYRKYNNP